MTDGVQRDMARDMGRIEGKLLGMEQRMDRLEEMVRSQGEKIDAVAAELNAKLDALRVDLIAHRSQWQGVVWALVKVGGIIGLAVLAAVGWFKGGAGAG